MEKLKLSINTLDWAAGNIGLSLQSIGEKVVAHSKLNKFLEGELTTTQAEKLARITNIPFGFLFLKEPPKIEQPSIPDLRQTNNPLPLSANFKEVLNDTIKKKDWYRSYLLSSGAESPSFLKNISQYRQETPEVIASKIRAYLGLTDEIQKKCRNTEEFFSKLTELIERTGILVFKSGIVKNNTKRTLDENEFRGFAITDNLSPVIFINGNDSKNAMVFTLAHELAHIWLGESGVSDIKLANSTSQKTIEIKCNKIAGELLVPKDQFIEKWGQEISNNFEVLSKDFKVSKLVIARRALDFGLIGIELYKKIEDESVIKRKKTSGGSPYNTLPIRNSKRFTRALINSTVSGKTMFREAANLLNVRTDTVLELSNRMNAHAK